jgi:hypothetical protein
MNGCYIKSIVLTAMLATAMSSATARAQPTSCATNVTCLAQGWSDADRTTFYTTVQGSHIMPYVWFKALRRLDVDEPFAADQLSRYGYIHSDSSTGLPVGFVIDGTPALGQVGMTCAACHTGQLEYQKDGVTHAIRLDGAPAESDFQQFLTDLRDASGATIKQPDRFAAFAAAVLGSNNTPAKAAQLKTQFSAWVQQFSDFMNASLPTSPWGPGRLDAFGMIFNRVTARDIGVVKNFKVADAPVSYPFLWNAHRQDHTQWNGGVPNGFYITALARNSGEVFGVFADYKPAVLIPATKLAPAIINYHSNSIVYSGLQTLEEKIAVLKPPPWPQDIFPLNPDMVTKGKALFDTNCGKCHNPQPSKTALNGAWDTPVLPVGTDPRMAANATNKSDPGMFAGAALPPPSIGARYPACPGTFDCALNVDLLASSVVGGLLADAFNRTTLASHDAIRQNGVFRALGRDLQSLPHGENLDDLTAPGANHLGDLQALIKTRLSNMYKSQPPAATGAAYESRVLQGIWATAPYLHNGSVPNLWELLTPPAQRKTSFMVGSRLFDPKNVGYSTDTSPFATGKFVVDATNGNGNGGHDFGTGLTDDQKWQIIEYMKQM